MIADSLSSAPSKGRFLALSLPKGRARNAKREAGSWGGPATFALPARGASWPPDYEGEKTNPFAGQVIRDHALGTGGRCEARNAERRMGIAEAGLAADQGQLATGCLLRPSRRRCMAMATQRLGRARLATDYEGEKTNPFAA